MANRQQTVKNLFGELSSDSAKDTDPPGPTAAPPPTDSNPRPACRLPRPGTSVQRSNRESRRKVIMLASPPPPRWPRSRGRRHAQPTPGPTAGRHEPSDPIGPRQKPGAGIIRSSRAHRNPGSRLVQPGPDVLDTLPAPG
nr:PREDICTED: transcription initiation factor TFIID subunit 4-like [Linepithema humile]